MNVYGGVDTEQMGGGGLHTHRFEYRPSPPKTNHGALFYGFLCIHASSTLRNQMSHILQSVYRNVRFQRKYGPLVKQVLSRVRGSYRSATIDSAIYKGIRKSQGLGFRGKEWLRDKGTEGRGGTSDIEHEQSISYSGRRNIGDTYRQQSNADRGLRGRQDRPEFDAGSSRSDRSDQDFKRRPDQSDRISSSRSKYGGDGEKMPRMRRDMPRSRNEQSFGRISYQNTDAPDNARYSGRDARPTKFSSEMIAPRSYIAKVDKQIPISIPYTTPASEFLYGTSSVEAALQSSHGFRRQLYKLYIYAGENRDESESNKDMEMKRLARSRHVPVEHVRIDRLSMMDKMSGGRPHNGFILEASPLPQLPVKCLGSMTSRGSDEPGFEVKLAHQSREELKVNGDSNFVPMTWSRSQRHPLVLLLDGVKDPGNLGAIIRTANFFGVDAIVQTAKHSAPISQVAAKASAGASESTTILTVRAVSDEEFVAGSKRNGWTVYAAVAPTDPRSNKRQAPQEQLGIEDLGEALKEGPCLVLLGSEGEGLRIQIKRQADFNLVIQGTRQRGAVESLNVSVAAALLCHGFLGQSHPRDDNRVNSRGRVSPRETGEGAESAATETRLF